MTKSSSSCNKPKIFSDFDGTISIGDVGNRLFHHFSDGRSKEPVDRWLAGEIDSRQCLEEEGKAIRNVTEDELMAFFDGFNIDPGFKEFVDFCRDHNWPLYILSDGLDIYIHRILKANGIADQIVLANGAELIDGRLRFTFPYFEHSCGGCANCKGYQIRRLSDSDGKAVYIGDGKSDLCAVPEADVVFAKGYLERHCRNNGLEFKTFDGFEDVTKKLRFLFK